jgi:transposase
VAGKVRQDDTIGVESTGSYAAGLLRYLPEHDIGVVEVNQPHPTRAGVVGKSDPVDPEMAARLFFARQGERDAQTGRPDHRGNPDATSCRSSAVKARPVP